MSVQMHKNRTNVQNTHESRPRFARPNKGSKHQRLKAGGTRTHRNPTSSIQRSGRTSNRTAERRSPGGSSNDPPRTTREDPEAGPTGFTATPESYAPNQSRTHSQAFPCMS